MTIMLRRCSACGRMRKHGKWVFPTFLEKIRLFFRTDIKITEQPECPACVGGDARR